MKQREPQTKREPSEQGGPPPGAVKSTRPNSKEDLPKALPASRKWGFRFAAVVLVPLVLFGALELGLRISGYGYPTKFFKPLRIGDRDYLVENDKFGLRFFPPELSRSPAPVRMEAHKQPGTCRIFILGESAALGDPRPAYGAGRYLEVLLRERFPSLRFEVVCVAMTAINSHAILPISRECARQEGDIWIVYMGNNEMVGPFGATTVFGPSAPGLTVVRVNLALQKTRVGQWLLAVSRSLRRGSPAASTWAGMEMFVKSQVPSDAPVREAVYRNFESNLRDILRAGLGSGARVLLNTVAVNLKDCPPFGSLKDQKGEPSLTTAHSPQDGERPNSLRLLSAAETNAEQRTGAVAGPLEQRVSQPLSVALSPTNEQGHDHSQSSRNELARRNASQADEQSSHPDSKDAELHFRLGRSFLASTNLVAAAKEFSEARDLDTLPFRATSRLNSIITLTARELTGPSLSFFDAAAFCATNSPGGIPGNEWFYEHVHFNFDGNYRLARAWAGQVEAFLPAAVRNGASAEWASQEFCERRLGLTDWNRADVLDDLVRRMSQPPLSTQPNNQQRVAELRSELTALRQKMTPDAAKSAARLYLEALGHAPEDFQLHENFAQFLETVGDLREATAQWQRVRDLIPHHHLGWFETGRLLARQGQWAEARTALSQALSLRPDLSEGWLELGQVEHREGKDRVALADYERARRLLPQDHRVYYHMGNSLSKLNRKADAIQQFRQAVRLKPTDWEALYALGEELAFDGQVEEAALRFQQVLQLKPEYPPAHLNLGVALVALQHPDQAIAQFRETLRLEPRNQLAQEYLTKVQAHFGK